MNQKQQNRLIIILSMLILLSSAIGLILYALKQNINLFYTPTQLLTADFNPEQTIRLGGYVKKHSVKYSASGESVEFIVTDRVKELGVTYQGVLPSLFREGQAVVVTGTLATPTLFSAREVLAKHDEKYMPKPLQHLKRGNGYGA